MSNSAMTHENGPIYNSVPLIDRLPIPGSNMFQAMPSRRDLESAKLRSERTVAGYEVLLSHWYNQAAEIERLKRELAVLTSSA